MTGFLKTRKQGLKCHGFEKYILSYQGPGLKKGQPPFKRYCTLTQNKTGG